jgi:hypothetical protein
LQALRVEGRGSRAYRRWLESFLDVAEERDGHVQIALSESAHPGRSVWGSLKTTHTHHRQRVVKALRVSVTYSVPL